MAYRGWGLAVALILACVGLVSSTGPKGVSSAQPKARPDIVLSAEEQELVRQACTKAFSEEIGLVFKYRTATQEGRQLAIEDERNNRTLHGLDNALSGYRRCLVLVASLGATASPPAAGGSASGR